MASGRSGWLRVKSSKLAVLHGLAPYGFWHFVTGGLAVRKGGQSVKTACGYIATYKVSLQEWADSAEAARIKAGQIPEEVCWRCQEISSKSISPVKHQKQAAPEVPQNKE
jgi:hypothetical protein